MRINQLAATAVLALAVAGISACGGVDYGIAALDREATPEDQLPEVMSDNMPSLVSDLDLDVDSVRKVAENDGVTYYLGKRDDDEGFCVFPTTADDWLGGCGEAYKGRLVSLSPGEKIDLPQVTLVEDHYSTQNLERDDWNQVHDNIWIR